MKYDRVLIFVKKGNLLDYLNTDKVSSTYTHANVEGLQKYYGKEREIRLIACVRWETIPVSTRKGIVQKPVCYCKIKCPVNPMPVKGEFELPSLESLRAFLKANGWTLKQDVSACLFE